ncbi:CidA/LrgA family protein [Mesobacillus foraminis]|uniref:CidA/LrgA family protein n=1 Tax=Mesobacillus foraminis TaxID=279826 RepID=UPI001BE6E904|nr:CidA/LrgA family protein [Mesobacillus foraminis]MBT2755136.1 CidA/LrgA family protein [Mesobacillus foraminis]
MNFDWLRQFFILTAFLLLGYGIVNISQIPLPASVAGMLLLLLTLVTGMIKLEWIEKVSSFQLKHLTLLLIPPIVSLFISRNFLEIVQWPFLVIIIVSSLSSLLGTAFTVEFYEKMKRRNTG